MEDLISVIVPIYNVEKYLKKCVDSIINQTYSNLEIILVDDGSPDNCALIVDEYAKKDKRIKVIHKENGGLSSARNAGLEIATGKYVGFVDSDDTISNEQYEVLYKLIKKYNTKVAFARLQKFGEDEKGNIYTYPSNNEKTTDKVITIEDAIGEILLNEEVGHYVHNKLYARELFDGIEFPLGRTFEDVAILYKVLDKVDKIAYTNQKLYYYLFKRKGAITEKFSESKVKDSLDFHYAEYKYFYEKYPAARKYLTVSFIKSYTSLTEKLYLNNYEKLCINESLLDKYEDFKIAMLEAEKEMMEKYLEPYRLISAIMLNYNREMYKESLEYLVEKLKKVT